MVIVVLDPPVKQKRQQCGVEAVTKHKGTGQVWDPRPKLVSLPQPPPPPQSSEGEGKQEVSQLTAVCLVRVAEVRG